MADKPEKLHILSRIMFKLNTDNTVTVNVKRHNSVVFLPLPHDCHTAVTYFSSTVIHIHVCVVTVITRNASVFCVK